MDIPEIYLILGNKNGNLGFLLNWGVFPRKVTPVELTFCGYSPLATYLKGWMKLKILF